MERILGDWGLNFTLWNAAYSSEAHLEACFLLTSAGCMSSKRSLLLCLPSIAIYCHLISKVGSYSV